LPVPYFHVVFTLPAAIADLAYHNKAVIYDLLFKASSETVLAIAADPKHLGARIGITAVLRTWGSTPCVRRDGRPFGGPEAVLAYLSRYTHRVAISNRRLIALDENGVTFNYKDYRGDGRARYKVMTLATSEFIRRFLIHVLPKGFHRIRYYGLLAKSSCAENLARARQLLAVSKPQVLTDNDSGSTEPSSTAHPCPCCGGRMIIIEAFAPGCQPHHRPSATTIAIRIDSS
jgi:Putative transposase